MVNKGKLDKEDKEQRRESVIKNFLGKNVAIILRCGTNLKGRLESVAQYELIITISHKPVIIMKHAVDYIEFVDESTESTIPS